MNAVQNMCKPVNYDFRKWGKSATSGPLFHSPGNFLITLCAKNLRPLFGQIDSHSGFFIASETGQLVEQFWREIPDYTPEIILHDYVLMPNHLHGILELPESLFLTKNKTSPIARKIGLYKAGVTKSTRERLAEPDLHIWTAGFHAYKILTGEKLASIKQKIQTNQENWAQDCFFVEY